MFSATAPLCEPGAVAWIEALLGECAYSQQEEAAVVLGYLSISFWLFAQIPQLIENTKRGTSESLSLIFLCNWLSGDFANLIGCIFTNQLPFQTYLAIYFVFIDTSLFVQTLYFRLKKARFDSVQRVDEQTPLLRSRTSSISSLSMIALGFIISTAVSVPTDAVESGIDLLEPPPPPLDASYQLGRLFAWICCLLYLSSRIPQIYKNFQRKSTNGLAMSMFVCALMGNLTYSLSILVKSVEPAYIYNALPYLLGSAGTVVFDFVIFTQHLVWNQNAIEEEVVLNDETHLS